MHYGDYAMVVRVKVVVTTSCWRWRAPQCRRARCCHHLQWAVACTSVSASEVLSPQCRPARCVTVSASEVCRPVSARGSGRKTPLCTGRCRNASTDTSSVAHCTPRMTRHKYNHTPSALHRLRNMKCITVLATITLLFQHGCAPCSEICQPWKTVD